MMEEQFEIVTDTADFVVDVMLIIFGAESPREQIVYSLAVAALAYKSAAVGLLFMVVVGILMTVFVGIGILRAISGTFDSLYPISPA